MAVKKKAAKPAKKATAKPAPQKRESQLRPKSRLQKSLRPNLPVPKKAVKPAAKASAC